MALVAYDYDSSSENEDEEESVSYVVNTNINNANPNSENNIQHSNEVKLQYEEVTSNSLFSTLPQTKMLQSVAEDQIEDFIPKSESHAKQKQKVKIAIPALSQFIDVDEDEPHIKKLKPLSKGSSLISILPPVKGSITTTKSFIPNVVKNQTSNSSVSNTKTNILIPNIIRKKAEVKKTMLQKIQVKENKNAGSDVESDDDIDIPETFDDEMWEKVCGKPKPKQFIRQSDELPSQQKNVDSAPEPEKPYEGLDNKAFKELIGKSKRPIGNIKLIDINEEEILPDKDLWMTKSLTDPEMAPKPQIENPVDPTRRKKHHITYLAQQAKANEQELQNAWSASKNNRMATRAKYGF